LRDTLNQASATIIEGPVERMGGRHGGRAKATSVYIRDPDSNLLEFMIYPDSNPL
jgi:catechol 2,3-dioxygenase-like lactoylglutathione lyase family enzyme